MKRTVIRADVYGFCSGVRRAVDLALEAGAETGAAASAVYTLGQLVHNPRIMEMLKERGVSTIDDPGEISDGTVLIRAHGSPAGTVESLEQRGVKVIDATCPKVTRSHTIIETCTQRGYHVIVAGEREHHEVQGLVSRTKSADVVETAEEAAALDCSGPAIVIAQTTFKTAEYEKICLVLKDKLTSVEIFKTICPAMEKRCEALDRLALKVDTIIVIGGKNSANTRRLFEQANKSGLSSWHVEGPDDLPDEVFEYEKIGITAGASTPDYIVQEVQDRLESQEAGNDGG